MTNRFITKRIASCAASARMGGLILGLFLATMAPQAAGAQAWTTHTIARYGASVAIPPGFDPVHTQTAAGEEVASFRASDGSELTLLGADLPDRDFEAGIQRLMASDAASGGWRLGGSTITPSWAEYSASIGRRQLRVRVEAACGGRQLAAVKFAFNDLKDTTISRLFASLRAGPAEGC